MRLLAKLLLAVIGCFFHLFAISQTTFKHVVALNEGVFTIVGQTNVGGFTCKLSQNTFDRAIEVYTESTSEHELKFRGFKMRFPVGEFDCGLSQMNDDFEDLLQAEDYPFLFLELHKLYIPKENTSIEELKVVADVSVTLAGQTRQYQITAGKLINETSEDLVLIGEKLLKMTDFGIEPPTKLMGLVRVSENLDVSFEIRMHVSTQRQ